ncbi:MAG: hypothetical protein WA254_01160 [Candidatus Sulfotelmatobacter sp.]
MNSSPNARFTRIAALIAVLVVGAQATGKSERDPHRLPCASARCRRIKSFLKARYCGESPFGNGPDDGCEIKRPKTPAAGIKVLADFDCKWIDGISKCQQHAQPPSEMRAILIREMRKLGLPVRDDGQLYFTVWEPTSAGWAPAEAYYQHLAGPDLTICQLVATVDRSSQVRALRTVPFQKTDADVPAATIWTPIDLADIDGTGQVDVVLEADAYEDHWLEVDSVKDGFTKTIFSGLGYYL